MKGVVFQILEDIVNANHGPDTWEGLLEQADTEGAYTTLGSYPDGEFMALAHAYCEVAGDDIEGCLRHMGRAMLPRLGELYPEAMEHHPDTLRMLHALNDVIHPEVIKLYPGAIVPIFRYHRVEHDRIDLEYDSPRELCSLAHGLMLGVGDHFSEHVEVSHTECRHHGGDRCLFTVRVGNSHAAAD